MSWELKGVTMGSRAIAIAKRFGGTVADAEWLRDCLIKAFEEGTEWERKEAQERELLRKKYTPKKLNWKRKP